MQSKYNFSGLDIDEAQTAIRNLRLSKEQVYDLANDTVGQFNNVLYCAIKKYRITSTKFHQVLNMLGDKSAPGRKPGKGKMLIGMK